MFSPLIRVAVLQAAFMFAASAAFWLMGGGQAAQAGGYGGLVALLATLLMFWHERQGRAHPEWSAQQQLGRMMLLQLQRLVLVAVLLGVGLVSGKLMALPMLAGFVLGQLGWLAVIDKNKKQA